MAERERLGYRPALDGLRAAAVVAVLIAHSSAADRLPGANVVGVDVFFVLSGFLITVLLIEERECTGRIDLRGFYLRRARRLLPALAAFLGVTTVVGALTSQSWGVATVKAIPFASTYTTNIARQAFDMDPALMIHTWSLSVEEHFYLVWPVGLVLAHRAGWPLRRLVAVVAVLAGTSLALQPHALESADWIFGTHTRGGAILVGCLVAFAWRQGWRFQHRLIGPMAAAVLVAVSFKDSYGAGFAGRWSGIGWVAAAVLTLAVVDRPGRFLTSVPLVRIGRISYGIYLWHLLIHQLLIDAWPGLHVGLELGVTALVSVAVAAVSYRWIEHPFLRARRLPSNPPDGATSDRDSGVERVGSLTVLPGRG